MIEKCLAFAMACAASPAFALSCLPADPVGDYVSARDDAATYSMVIGRITASGPIAEPTGTNRPEPENKSADTRVRVTGRGLSASGFDVDFKREITLRLTCFGPWCAGAPELGKDLFLILRHQNGARIAELTPCPNNAHPWSAENEARLVACHRTGQCARLPF